MFSLEPGWRPFLGLVSTNNNIFIKEKEKLKFFCSVLNLDLDSIHPNMA
jgi:hypothetical protein